MAKIVTKVGSVADIRAVIFWFVPFLLFENSPKINTPPTDVQVNARESQGLLSDRGLAELALRNMLQTCTPCGVNESGR